MDNLLKLTPIDTRAQTLGAQFTIRKGWRVADSFRYPENEVAAAHQGVALADESARGKVIVEGSEADAIVQETFGTITLRIGSGRSIRRDGHVYRLRSDKYYVSTPPGGESGAHRSLTEAARWASELVTITDITHGRTELRLIGSASIELLSLLCGLDFHAAAFPNLTAMQSSLAKTAQLIIRRDFGGMLSFSLVGARSFGPYLWDTLMEAGRDLNIVAIGQHALDNICSTFARKP